MITSIYTTSVYTIEHLLTPAECDAAISLFPPTRPGKTLDAGAVRRSRVAFAPDLVPPTVRQQIQRVFLRAADDVFRFDAHHYEPLQLAEYGEGDHYDWHLDLGKGSTALRKLSMSVQLSDPSDYDGGALEIRGAPEISRVRGSAVLFPSFLLHRVAPVTRGLRRSLVAWALGERPFR